MTCYEELKARGLIAQVTNEEEISKMIDEGKAVFYIGFDEAPPNGREPADCPHRRRYRIYRGSLRTNGYAEHDDP